MRPMAAAGIGMYRRSAPYFGALLLLALLAFWPSYFAPPQYEKDWPEAFPRLVDARYLQVMRIPLIAGRQLSDDDRRDTPRVIILNRSAAATLFPGRGFKDLYSNLGSPPNPLLAGFMELVLAY